MGAYEGKELCKHWRISTDRQMTGDEYGMLINSLFHYQGIEMADIHAIIISSVVPPLVVPFIKMCELYFHLRPLIVIDIGTATTFDVVAKNGDFLGGVIAPGIGTSSEALFQRAAQLPRIELVPPKNIICRNTIQGMQAGIIFGYVGQIDEIARRIKREMRENGVEEEVKVIATGGLARMISTESATIDKIDHFLTLMGLRVLYERNQKGHPHEDR